MPIKQKTIKSIHILRAIAALSIVYRHCTVAGDYKLISTGAFGVDIFFVISGFIISYIVTKSTQRFLINRIIRIWPLYFFATLLMIITVVVFKEHINKTEISVSGFIKSLLFIPGKENRGLPILAQGWTLNYEMLFYLLTYISIFIVKDKKYIPLICGISLSILLIIAYIVKVDIYIIEYYRIGLIPEFIGGIIIYYGIRKINNLIEGFNRKIVVIICLLFALFSIALMVYFDITKHYIFENRNIYWGIPAMLLVLSILLIEKDISNGIIIKFLIILGESSYAMYLFHYHIIAFLSRILFPKIFGVMQFPGLKFIQLLIAIIITIVISILIYQYIDKKIQNVFRKK